MLYTRFLEEALPSAEPVPVSLFRSFGDRTPILKDDAFELAAPDGTQSAFLTDLPANYRLTMTVDPRSSYDEAGLFIRAKDNADRGYKLELNALKRMVLLHNLRIEGVTGLDKKLTLDIVVREDMIDVCIGGAVRGQPVARIQGTGRVLFREKRDGRIPGLAFEETELRNKIEQNRENLPLFRKYESDLFGSLSYFISGK